MDSSPGSAILDLLFIARRPRRVLPTSFTGDVTLKPAGRTGDEAGHWCFVNFFCGDAVFVNFFVRCCGIQTRPMSVLIIGTEYQDEVREGRGGAGKRERAAKGDDQGKTSDCLTTKRRTTH